MDITLSNDQLKCMQSIENWLKLSNKARDNNSWYSFNKPYLTFGGLAGTGKTTMIAKLISETDCSTQYICCMALSGRAAFSIRKAMDKLGVNLKNKSFSTIHHFLYKPIIKDGKVADWEFDPKYKSRQLKLIIVDEASMITKELLNDLLRLNTPILFVGDFGQLPPIKGKLNLMHDPDIRLSKIHRQALDSPIIQLSMLAREGKFIPYKEFSNEVKKLRTVEAVEHLVNRDSDFVFLTATNRNRVKLNRSALNFMELDEYRPEVGTRVVCLKNNYNASPPIFNGQLGLVEAIEPDAIDYRVSIRMEGNGVFTGTINGDTFNNEKPNIQEPTFHRSLALFDFGYALTCHKAQGSQFERVFVFGNGFGDREMRSRWLYTAITRAEKELYICGDRM